MHKLGVAITYLRLETCFAVSSLELLTFFRSEEDSSNEKFIGFYVDSATDRISFNNFAEDRRLLSGLGPKLSLYELYLYYGAA